MTKPIVIVANCKRCGKRPPTNPDWSRTWNDTWIAGLHAGRLCPACQTDEEDLEAQVHDATDLPLKARQFASVDDWIAYSVPELTRMYRTPEKLRAKADELDAVRQDGAAQAMTGLMRALAADLEDER
jgi:hypothetical protein